MNSNPPSDPTVRYYDEVAEAYRDQTINLDLKALYAPFLSYMPPRGKVLDAGCGPGRDVKAFMELGFAVTAIDGSSRMCELASTYLGQNVMHMGFLDIEWANEFDGIWACASLLHVQRADLPEALLRLVTALKRRGVLYASFKHGDTQGLRGARWFTNLTEIALRELIQQTPGLVTREVWLTSDIRPGREEEVWLNVVATKD